MGKLPNDICVHIVTHEKTGLLVAMSDDLKGLHAHARTIEELEANIKTAIKDIYEETYGKSVTVSHTKDSTSASGFKPNAMRFSANDPVAA